MNKTSNPKILTIFLQQFRPPEFRAKVAFLTLFRQPKPFRREMRLGRQTLRMLIYDKEPLDRRGSRVLE
jgi:hypothetical protein